jgi:hypothetical protein
MKKQPRNVSYRDGLPWVKRGSTRKGYWSPPVSRFGVRDVKTAKTPIFCTGHADIAQNVGGAVFRLPRSC